MKQAFLEEHPYLNHIEENIINRDRENRYPSVYPKETVIPKEVESCWLFIIYIIYFAF